MSPTRALRFVRMVKKRATWLIILFVGEMLTATAMASYEDRNRARRRARGFSANDHFERR